MTTTQLSAGAARPITGETDGDDRTYVDWGAILAGAVLAAAISLVLLSFGSAIGLGITSPLPGEGVSLFWFAIAAGLWLLWVQVSSFMAGGYLAGRLRRRIGDSSEDESDLRDGSHGLIVWAVGTLVGAFMLMSGIMGAANTAVQGAGAAAEAVASAAPDEMPDNLSSYLTDTLFRAQEPGAAPTTGGNNQDAGDTAQAVEEAGRIVTQSLIEGEFTADDRAYLVQIVAAETGLDPQQVEARVVAVEERVVAMRDDALEAADNARQIGVLAAFLVAASLLVSAAGAYFAAGMGGRHRDDGTIIPRWRPSH
jgi:hypothetical protein